MNDQHILTKNEKKVLNGICRYPHITDSELSTILQVKLSTLTSIKRRLIAQQYYRPLIFPFPNRLGCELLAITYIQYNPVIPLKRRVETARRTIEVFEEMIFSVGEEEKGFSISLSQNYTNIGRINEIRTETFGKLGLLEKEFPHEVIFPFEISTIHRFFDFSPFLQEYYKLEDIKEAPTISECFRKKQPFELSSKEKKVYYALVEHPVATTQQIGDLVNLSRHTVARMKNHFIDEGLLQKMIIPDLKKLGIEILTFSHIHFNLSRSPTTQELTTLNTPSTIFFASKKFEAVLLSIYQNYQDYKEDEMKKIKFLKENNLFSHPPFISTYSTNRMEIIKDFNFSALVRKIFGSSTLACTKEKKGKNI